MRRFYCDEQGVHNGVAYLPEEDAHHALKVLRMQEGDVCELFADGGRYACVVDDASNGQVRLRVTGDLPTTEAGLRVTLYQGLPKAEKMELIVQKAVELGAASIVPVQMSRCVMKLDGKDALKKQERWQRIAREACKQSGRCIMPEVAAPISMKQLLNRIPEHGLVLIPWEDDHTLSLTAIRAQHPDVRELAVIIGPEGGMSEEEVHAMKQAGGLPVTLGPRILRTETAGMAAMAALFCLYGDMEAL